MSQAIPTAAKAPVTDGVILRAQGLKKTFRMGEATVAVLREVDLSVKTGEFLAVEGRSGSGKSTLLHILGLLDNPDAGSVEYEGRNLSSLSSKERSGQRNRQFGFVFQFYHLLPELNVLQNTMLAAMVQYSWMGFQSNRAELVDRATALLDQFGMTSRLKHRPSQLSGGERQRVAIARALMNKPRVLFADEPTGNLDSETGRQIMDVIDALHRDHGQTIVMVTHDRTIAKQADRAMVLADGKLRGA